MKGIGRFSCDARCRQVSAILIVLLVFTFGCREESNVSGKGGKSEFASNGERIYFTATSEKGTPIKATGMMHEMNHVCADCHGADGRGRTFNMMMGTITAPDIRYNTLTGADHHHEGGGSGHDDGDEHSPYTDETIKRAITMGMNPAGDVMNTAMPRWEMSDEDLDDLIDFLRKLK